ncbi:MAG: hypothetical protein WEB30_15265 [Cyclobacteriaceae bacterium]
MKNLKLLICIGAFLAASEGLSQVRTADDAVISESVNDDLYVAAGTVTVKRPCCR